MHTQRNNPRSLLKNRLRGYFLPKFLKPRSLCYIGCGVIFCPKNKYHYSLLLLRMAAWFRALRRDRMNVRFRVTPPNQHPMMSWLTHPLPEDVARQIYQDHIFPEVSHCHSAYIFTHIFYSLGFGANQNDRTPWWWVFLDSPIYLGGAWWWLLLLKTGIWIYIPTPRKRILAWGYSTIVLFDGLNTIFSIQTLATFKTRVVVVYSINHSFKHSCVFMFCCTYILNS